MRKITREKVMELLYLLDIHRQVAREESLSIFLNNDIKITDLIEVEKEFLLNNKDDMDYFEATFNGVVDKLPEIDEQIKKYMKSTWSLEQIGFVERAILRLAIYELNFSEQDGLVTEIIISSALEIAEKYTDENSVKFVHGILGAMVNNISPKTAKKRVSDSYKKQDKATAKENLLKFKKMKDKSRNS